MRLPDDVLRALGADPGIDRVEPTGSRASGRARPQSDWDFQIATEAFPEVQERMPALVTPLQPVVAQWDRLSRTWCFMLLLAGPVKVDLIFDQPHVALPPWRVTAATLPGIDDHFWDWMLWLSGKRAAGRRELVAAELGRLHEYLLGPLGVTSPPAILEQAITDYRAARASWQGRLGCRVSRAAERAVMPVFGGTIE
jgi:hypothetical protein